MAQPSRADDTTPADTQGMELLRAKMRRSPGVKLHNPPLAGEAVGELFSKGLIERRRLEAEQREKESARMMEAIRRNRSMNAIRTDLGPRYAPDRASLSTYRVYSPQQKAVFDRVKKLAGQIATHAGKAGGVIFYGIVGTGKDHLLAALLYHAAAASIDCRWLNGQEAFGKLHDNMDTGKRDEDFFAAMDAPQILGISDPLPPHGNLSAWNISQFYRLVDRRYRLLKPTWITVNAESEDEADEKLSAPVFDRLKEGAEIFPCFWPSNREAKHAVE